MLLLKRRTKRLNVRDRRAAILSGFQMLVMQRERKEGETLDCWSTAMKADVCHHYVENMKEPTRVKLKTHLFEGNHPDEAPDAGDVGVVEAQEGEDGVGLGRNK